MRPVQKTTLSRMRDSAADEANKIEGFHDRCVARGYNRGIPESAALRRDDFDGIVRLIDTIRLDPELLAMVQRKMKA